MNTTHDTSNNLAPAQAWPVVILSRDFAVGRQLGALVQRELPVADPGVSVESQVWLFSSLNQPSLFRLAVMQALSAHLVVLCPCAHGPFPLGVKRFLRDWTEYISDPVSPLLVLPAEGHPVANAGMVGVVSRSDGTPRVPVYLNVAHAVSAARELARLRSAESAPTVRFETTWTEEALSPEDELVS